MIESEIESPTVELEAAEEKMGNPIQLRYKLTEFKLNKSREEKIKACFIFSNNQMEDLIIRHPKTMEDLIDVNGFGKIKVNKYGADILKLLN